MVERDQDPAEPLSFRSRSSPQIQSMTIYQAESEKRNCSQGDDHGGIDEFDFAPEKRRAIPDFTPPGAAVSTLPIARIAKYGIGNEALIPPQAGLIHQKLKNVSGSVTPKRHSRAVGAEPARRLGDEHQPGTDFTVGRTKNRSAPCHGVAQPATGSLSAQIIKIV